MAGLLAGPMVAVAVLLAMPAAAQDDARLRRLEAEVRALQRAVFPGGDGRYFTPEVVTPAPGETPQPGGNPSASALTDVLARLEALESQIASLTARSEETAHQLRELQAAQQAATAAAAPPPPSGIITPPGQTPAQPAAELPAQSAAATPAPAPSPAAAQTAAPSPQRVAAVQAIAKPMTGDPGEDEYTYGFRLWEAGFYPEAQQQLALFLQRYPNHARATYARNLLGRAYLDNGQPREAATYFFENYQADRQAARAPDSLLFLAEAMVAIGDTNRACIALAEFGETYPALATGRLKEQYDRARNQVRCG
jgi:TolA-binding protein